MILLPGFNCIVLMVGSTNVHMCLIFSEPYPVHNLTATEVTTNTVTLTWEQLESKPSYSYMVQTSNGSVLWSERVLITTVNITGLISGRRYEFIVTSETADGTQALQVTTSLYTRTCLTC